MKLADEISYSIILEGSLLKTFITVLLVTNVLRFEVAVTEAEKQTGLMFRKSWGNIDGMVFINEEPSRATFWMKNTYLPMAMWYLDSNCNLLETHFPEPLSTSVVYSEKDDVMYIVELKPELTNLVLAHYEPFRQRLLRQCQAILMRLQSP